MHCNGTIGAILTRCTFGREIYGMTLLGDASGMPSDHPEPDASTRSYDQQQQPDFDINLFLGYLDAPADDEHLDRSRWRHRFSNPSIRGSLGAIVFSITISVLKKMSGAALMVFVVVFAVFGPNAPWGQLKWNILRGGADEASSAQCAKVGEWFSLFDQHTNRIYRLLDDAGSPDTWDTVTLAKVAELLPLYLDDWLAEMQKNQPPPEGRQLNVLFISLLENYGDYVRAMQEGDLKAQKYFERESSIILEGLDIEVRHILNLCI